LITKVEVYIETLEEMQEVGTRAKQDERDRSQVIGEEGGEGEEKMGVQEGR